MLVETDDPRALFRWISDWADIIDFEIEPVLEGLFSSLAGLGLFLQLFYLLRHFLKRCFIFHENVSYISILYLYARALNPGDIIIILSVFTNTDLRARATISSQIWGVEAPGWQDAKTQ